MTDQHDARRFVVAQMHASRARARRDDTVRKWLLLVVIVVGTILAAIAGDHPKLTAGLAVVLVATSALAVIFDQQARECDRSADDYRRMLSAMSSHEAAPRLAIALRSPEATLGDWLNGSLR